MEYLKNLKIPDFVGDTGYERTFTKETKDLEISSEGYLLICDVDIYLTIKRTSPTYDSPGIEELKVERLFISISSVYSVKKEENEIIDDETYEELVSKLEYAITQKYQS